MAGANYALCEKCVRKVIYVGEDDVEPIYCAPCYADLERQLAEAREKLGKVSGNAVRGFRRRDRERDEWKARAEAAEADTKRLDWLSEHHGKITREVGAHTVEVTGCNHAVLVPPGSTLRAAIDAAAGEEK